MNRLRSSILSLLLCFSMVSCAELNRAIGGKEYIKDFPPGEYDGYAKFLGESKKPLEEVVKEAENEQPSENDKALKGKAEKEQRDEVKVSFIPKEPGITDGVGVLTLQNSSDRFWWRADGDGEGLWNVMFVKDNNIYSNLKQTFKFNGLITASELEHSIKGRLYRDNDGTVEEFYLEAFQHFPPKIKVPKEAIAIKAGDPIDIDTELVGESQDDVSVTLESLGKDGRSQDLTIKSFATAKGSTKISLATEKGLSKGDYILYLVREAKHKSNSIPITVQ